MQGVETKNMISSIDQLDLTKKYSYADYLTWRFKERVELLHGFIRKMSPAPSDPHQKISSYLHGMIFGQLRGKKCQVRHAPYDVRLIIPAVTPLSEKRRQKVATVTDTEIQTVVQPDIVVICDPEKIDKRGCLGAPDLVIEILSEGNNQDDTVEKFGIYEAAGINEYWIVHPSEQTVIIYSLNEEGQYIGSKPYAPGSVLRSTVLTGMALPVSEIFE